MPGDYKNHSDTTTKISQEYQPIKSAKINNWSLQLQTRAYCNHWPPSSMQTTLSNSVNSPKPNHLKSIFQNDV